MGFIPTDSTFVFFPARSRENHRMTPALFASLVFCVKTGSSMHKRALLRDSFSTC